MDIFSVITLLGGLAMFLYGMEVMGDGLEKCFRLRAQAGTRQGDPKSDIGCHYRYAGYSGHSKLDRDHCIDGRLDQC